MRLRSFSSILCFCGWFSIAQAQKPPAYSLERWAGGTANLPFTNSGPDAKAAYFHDIAGVAMDGAGNIYFVASDAHRVYRLNADGSYVTVAGTGTGGQPTDGKQASQSQLSLPMDVAFDTSGNMYIAGYSRVYKVTADGAIRTIAGGGSYGEAGDGQLATKAYLSQVFAVAIDKTGNVYFADNSRYRICKIDVAGILTTVAGGSYGTSGDGGPATSAKFWSLTDLEFDAAGTLYVVDQSAQKVRKITVDGKINKAIAEPIKFTNAGTNSMSMYPNGVALDAQGNMYVTSGLMDTARWNVMYKCDPAGNCAVIAGSEQVLGKYLGRSGYSGDGGQATSAKLANPNRVMRDAAGNLYFSDYKRLRKISAAGTITTLAGSTAATLLGEGKPLSQLALVNPRGMAADANGNLFIADEVGHRVWKISSAGVVTGLAGTGTPGFSGDGGPANQAELSSPKSVSVDATGNAYIAEFGNNRIRKVTTDGKISTAAGRDWDSCDTGQNEGARATDACFNVYDAVADSTGTMYIAAGIPYQVSSAGIVRSLTSVFKDGSVGELALDKQGNLYGLVGWGKLVKMTPGGVGTTIAGTGTNGHTGDGGPATAAQIEAQFLAVGPDGAIYLGEGNQRSIRHIGSDGIIRSIAGKKDGISGEAALGMPALNVAINMEGMAADASGNLYMTTSASTENSMYVQRLEPGVICRKCVTNAASYRGGVVSGGEILTIFGMDTFGPPSLSTYQLVDSNKRFADEVAGTKVLFDGVKSPIIYVAANQASVVAPYSIRGKQTTQMVVDYNGKRSNAVTLDVLAAVPGIFTIDQSGKNQGAVLNYPSYAVNGTANKIAKGGVIMIFATSGGEQGQDGMIVEGAPVHPLPVEVWIDNRKANVIYAGSAPGLISGMLQINAEVPTGARSGTAIPVYIKVGSERSDASFSYSETVTIAIQ
jgi:uncharacterized protein (TIGR03437 family)